MKTRVLITVKTYPHISGEYDELVCTAGITENGKWIRIYPIPFRKMDYEKQYAKYQWVELDLIKNTKDFRPESYRPTDYRKLKCKEKIKTDGKHWAKRRQAVLQKVYYDTGALIAEAKNKNTCTSLAIFKPSKIEDFIIEKDEREWNPKKLAKLKQMKLFEDAENPFEIVAKLPFKFSYKFKDIQNKESTLKIEDWETGQLYWNCLKRHNGDEKKACADVKKKYFDDFVYTKDVYLFLGTTKEFHFVSPNPFIIIGVFYPKHAPPQQQFNI